MRPLDAALAYAARGWLTFPIRPGQKKPATENGLLDATTDPVVIERWWTARKGFEERNVAIVTARESGIWVLDSDIDKETGEIGEDTIAALIAEHGELPRCPTQRTPGGGLHRFFAWPEDGLDLPRRIRFRPGLDALGSRREDGKEYAGYLVIAPSRRPDGEYQWIISPNDCDPPQAPMWLVKIIREGKKERPAGPRMAPVMNGQTTPYGRVTLNVKCEEIASCMSGQDDNLIRCATRIGSVQAGGNIDYNEAFNAAVEAGMRMVNTRPSEPWTRKVIEKKVAKAMAYGAKNPTFIEHRYNAPPREYAPPIGEPMPEPTARPKPQLVVDNDPPPNDGDGEEKPKKKKRRGSEWMTGLSWILNDEGGLKPTSLHNAQLFLRHHPGLKDMYWYDEFADLIFVAHPLPGETATLPYPRELKDHDDTALAAWMNANGLAPSISTAGAIIRERAFGIVTNPFIDWASALKWDGQKRIDTWLTYYAGAADTDYTRLVGRRFLISAMARGLNPGCKVDTMLVVEGAQGLKKSTMVRVLCGDDWFSDQLGDVRTKESAELLQGVWIIEVPEMDKFERPEANAVKAFLSRRFDRYRPPYGKTPQRRERRVIFFGTINPDGVGYLKDTTGNRRYWPVAVTAIDIEALAADRDQLWAEAKVAYEAGERWWLEDDEGDIVKPEQDARRDDDVWEPKVREWLDAAGDELKYDDKRKINIKVFTSSEVLWKSLGVELKNQKQSEKIRISKILKLLGCSDVLHKNGIKGRSWEYVR